MEEIHTVGKIRSIAIIGNPNVGKSSIFNQLTGLNQKIGNYPGVTVDKTVGSLRQGERIFHLIDLPGTYSLYPKSEDEEIAHRVLNGLGEERPDAALVILDAGNLERSLLLGTQVMDLGIPMAFLLNMKDLAEEKGLEIKIFELYKRLGVPLILTDARKKEGIGAIKELIFSDRFEVPIPVLDVTQFLPAVLIKTVKERYALKTDYQALQLLSFAAQGRTLTEADREWLQAQAAVHRVDLDKLQVAETVERYRKIHEVLSPCIVQSSRKPGRVTLTLDRFMLHPVLGYLVFLATMLLVFQAVFAWTEIPMDWIDEGFASLSAWINEILPAGVFTDLLVQGVIPGIGGIVIFIPQIALLFGFLAFLEDTGYLSRVVFLMDRLMKPFGLHGKSVVPLISGMACAIPGIMAARNISSNKERLITILVTPWMSCSARLPVYIILIGLTVTAEPILGINRQALALLIMYLLGISATLLGALVLKYVLKKGEKSYLICDLPIYRMPRWKAIGVTMFSKSKVFVLEAGKVIFSISIVLWVLASYGPSSRMDPLAEEKEASLAKATEEEREVMEDYFASRELENSYIGIMGKAIEPIIRPLGYDWKIGIALITSFAAREVFVATIATIYSIGSDVEDQLTIREKLVQEVNPNTGEKVFGKATAFSLMVFYAFAMQCMSTLAVVYRETKSWKWPLLQTVVMTSVAYLAALITFQLFGG